MVFKKETKTSTNQQVSEAVKKIYHYVHFCEERVNHTRSKSWFNSSLKKKTKEMVWDRVENKNN